MSYECSDFTDDVFNAFVEYGLISENDADDADDDPSRQASLVLRTLDDLIEEHGNLIVALKELLKWADKMGGWDAKCWKYAQNLVTRIEKKQPLSMGCCEGAKSSIRRSRYFRCR